MGLKQNKKAVAKFSLFLLVLTVVFGFSLQSVSATHTSSVNLEPEWSVPNSVNTYNVTFTDSVSSPDAVGEVRIYKNSNYENFSCDEKDGWILTFPAPGICNYYAYPQSAYKILPGDSEIFTFSAKSPAINPEQCGLTWQFETRDITFPDTGSIQYLNDVTKIDSEAPVTTKTYGEPFHSDGTYDWISTETPINLTAVDMSVDCGIGVDKLYWRSTLINVPDKDCVAACNFNGDDFGAEEFTEVNGDTTTFNENEESCHLIEFYAVDKLGNTERTKRQCVFVDDTPPKGMKTIEGKNISCTEGENCDYWVTESNSRVALDCEDQSPHPVYHEKACYQVSFDGATSDLTQQYCDTMIQTPGTGNNGVMENGWCCADVSEGLAYWIRFSEESKHTLSYYCEDGLGNKNDVDSEVFRVDETPPTINTSMVGTEHLGDCPAVNQDDECYVRDHGQNGVHIDVTDPDTTGMGCAVDNVTCEYFLNWRTDVTTCENAGAVSYDPIGEECLLESGTFGEEGQDVIFHEDSTHKLTVNCEDALGNGNDHEETYLVDSTPPKTNKTYGDPTVVKDGYRWILPITDITLSATDEKVGVDHIMYKVTNVGDDLCLESCGDESVHGNWTTVNGSATTFIIPDESCHYIEFKSVDKLGNMENLKSQCVMVDNTAPLVNKTIGDPSVVKDGNTYIAQQTPITLNCEDKLPHPVGDVNIWYRYRTSDDCLTTENPTWNNWVNPSTYCDGDYDGEWCDSISDGDSAAHKIIYFPEDSCHQLEYYCEDGLGNKQGAPLSEIDIVDTQAPKINFTVNEPYYYNETGALFIDNASSITIDAIDPQPHPVGDVGCTWSYTVNGKPTRGSIDEFQVPFTLQFPEESHHVLTVTCHDALGNSNTSSIDFYADHTPPAINKRYLGDYYENSQDDVGFWAEWINSRTEIHGMVSDAGPHLSGIKEVKYRTIPMSTEACKYEMMPESYNYNCDSEDESGVSWTTVDPESYSDFEFNIPEDSCHLIEIMATDNVGKCNLHKQYVYVDNQAPEPNKIVGEPREVWDGLDANFYNLSEFCSVEDNCWKVTTMTPITLDCNDLEPHPVSHEKIFFKVELDGDDYTTQYCGNITGGIYNESDGYCYILGEEAPVNFFFREESEHNLKYYCEDALGNKGPVDDEKFKVTGDAFTIHLNKKWNLVSTPVKLLDDKMDLVFDSPNSDIKSVWQFNGTDWFVYTPDGNSGNDAITTMEPGWGYWILADNPTNITIGGSLISPAMTPPSINIVPGWNLIGYYGTEGLTDYNGPKGNGKEASCELYSLGSSYLDKGWTSLISYWENYNPYQWSTEWVNTEQGSNMFDYYDNMDPGAGYWLLAPDAGIYAPTTTCNNY